MQSIKQNDLLEERKKSVPNISEKIDKDLVHQERAKSEGPPKLTKLYEKPLMMSNGPVDIPRFENIYFYECLLIIHNSSLGISEYTINNYIIQKVI